jgi:hypothetical protein
LSKESKPIAFMLRRYCIAMVGFCMGIQLHSEIHKFLSFSPAYGAFESLPVRQAGLSHRQFPIPFSYLLTEGWGTYPQKYNGMLACPCLPNTIKKGSQSSTKSCTKFHEGIGCWLLAISFLSRNSPRRGHKFGNYPPTPTNTKVPAGA